jgi:hypothetical protein
VRLALVRAPVLVPLISWVAMPTCVGGLTGFLLHPITLLSTTGFWLLFSLPIEVRKVRGSVSYIPHALSCLHMDTSRYATEESTSNVRQYLRRYSTLPIPDIDSFQLIDGTEVAYFTMLRMPRFSQSRLSGQYQLRIPPTGRSTRSVLV